jgi:hypothetical protein
MWRNPLPRLYIAQFFLQDFRTFCNVAQQAVGGLGCNLVRDIRSNFQHTIADNDPTIPTMFFLSYWKPIKDNFCQNQELEFLSEQIEIAEKIVVIVGSL